MDAGDNLEIIAFTPAPGFNAANNPLFDVTISTFPGQNYSFQTNKASPGLTPLLSPGHGLSDISRRRMRICWGRPSIAAVCSPPWMSASRLFASRDRRSAKHSPLLPDCRINSGAPESAFLDPRFQQRHLGVAQRRVAVAPGKRRHFEILHLVSHHLDQFARSAVSWTQ